MIHQQIQKEIYKRKDKRQAEILRGFFKTKKGEYGDGDVFLGVKVPVTRSIVKKFQHTATIEDARHLLKSRYHEVRLAGVLILIHLYKKFPAIVFTEHLKNVGVRRGINNWDLVDVSAYHIVGHYAQQYLKSHEQRALYQKLSSSKDLWVKRVAIVSTFHHIKNGDATLTFQIAKKYIHDSHDLIHKATGWMLREVGKRVSEHELKRFLKRHHAKMPRIMYRYATERIKNPSR